MLEFFSDLWLFLKERKKWWLVPIIVVLLLIGVILLLGIVAPSATPFVYTLF